MTIQGRNTELSRRSAVRLAPAGGAAATKPAAAGGASTPAPAAASSTGANAVELEVWAHSDVLVDWMIQAMKNYDFPNPGHHPQEGDLPGRRGPLEDAGRDQL